MKIVHHYKRWNALVELFSKLTSEGMEVIDALNKSLHTYKSRGHGTSKSFIPQWNPRKNLSRSKYNQENTRGKR